MEEIKKRHHYVWKHYLCSWSIKDDVAFTYLKKRNEVVQNDLKNFAQERFFYESEEFTRGEQKELLGLAYRLSDKNSLEACLGILSAFITYSEIKNLLVQKKIDFSENDIRFIKTNLIEDIHSDFEVYGRRLINVNTLENLDFLQNKKDLLHTMIYLCIQYTRTKQMRNNFYKSSLPNKFSNPVSIMIATNIANRLTFDKNLCFSILNNQSTLKFITGDQPVINLADINIDGSVNDFILYYPLNPKTAIQINIIDDKSTFETKNIKAPEVIHELNSKIYQFADNFIFSDSEEQILKYVQI